MTAPGSLQAREAYIISRVRSDGQVLYDPVDLTDAEPEISVRVKAPGGVVGHLGSFKYSEIYRSTRGGFELIEYAYGYWSQAGLGSLEFHWHPLPWSRRQNVFHTHCARPGDARRHYRAHALTFEEARGSFRLLYGSERAIDCSQLYPLDPA